MRQLLPVFVLLVSGILAVPAWAHAHLVAAVPAVGATAADVTVLKLKFSEPLEITFSKVELDGSDGKAIALGKPRLDAAGTTLIQPLAARLAAGSYTVHWHAVSVDTHRTEGTYAFTVKP